jgi:hypothetical protein
VRKDFEVFALMALVGDSLEFVCLNEVHWVVPEWFQVTRLKDCPRLKYVRMDRYAPYTCSFLRLDEASILGLHPQEDMDFRSIFATMDCMQGPEPCLRSCLAS